VKLSDSWIKFTLKDALVESVFYDPTDPPHSVNLKKAILSLLQNRAFAGETEKDVEIEV
jgi:hypothetical protein